MHEHESYHHKIDVKDVEAIWNTFGNRIKMFTEKWIERGVSYRTESNEPFNKWIKNNKEGKMCRASGALSPL